MFSPMLNGRALKATVVLDAAEIAGLRAPDGQPRITLRIKVGGRDVCADIATIFPKVMVLCFAIAFRFLPPAALSFESAGFKSRAC